MSPKIYKNMQQIGDARRNANDLFQPLALMNRNTKKTGDPITCVSLAQDLSINSTIHIHFSAESYPTQYMTYRIVKNYIRNENMEWRYSFMSLSWIKSMDY